MTSPIVHAHQVAGKKNVRGGVAMETQRACFYGNQGGAMVRNEPLVRIPPLPFSPDVRFSEPSSPL